MTSEEVYTRIIHQIDDFNKIYLTINKFRDVEYLHIRKYYLDFDGEWLPTKEGISMPLGISNTKELFSGLLEILSLAESKEHIISIFKEIIGDIYQ